MVCWSSHPLAMMILTMTFSAFGATFVTVLETLAGFWIAFFSSCAEFRVLSCDYFDYFAAFFGQRCPTYRSLEPFAETPTWLQSETCGFLQTFCLCSPSIVLQVHLRCMSYDRACPKCCLERLPHRCQGIARQTQVLLAIYLLRLTWQFHPMAYARCFALIHWCLQY